MTPRKSGIKSWVTLVTASTSNEAIDVCNVVEAYFSDLVFKVEEAPSTLREAANERRPRRAYSVLVESLEDGSSTHAMHPLVSVGLMMQVQAAADVAQAMWDKTHRPRVEVRR